MFSKTRDYNIPTKSLLLAVLAIGNRPILSVVTTASLPSDQNGTVNWGQLCRKRHRKHAFRSILYIVFELFPFGTPMVLCTVGREVEITHFREWGKLTFFCNAGWPVNRSLLLSLPTRTASYQRHDSSKLASCLRKKRSYLSYSYPIFIHFHPSAWPCWYSGTPNEIRPAGLQAHHRNTCGCPPDGSWVDGPWMGHTFGDAPVSQSSLSWGSHNSNNVWVYGRWW